MTTLEFDGKAYVRDILRRIKRLKLTDGYRITDVVYMGVTNCGAKGAGKFIVSWKRKGDEFDSDVEIPWYVAGSITTNPFDGTWIVGLRIPGRLAKLIDQDKNAS